MADEKRNDDSSCSWSREQDKAFENAIANYGENCLDRWEKIAEAVPGKSLQEIKEHYELLIDDITEIEAGRVPLPLYSSSSGGSSNLISEGNSKKGQQLGNFDGELNNGSKGSRADQERRKGIAWTEEEHKLFLLGLDKYGKGDWRSISRNFVVTRTPTQVASHAQKYFIRLNTMNKERRRSSIHDITSVNNVDATQGPITGQTNGTADGPTGKQNNLPDQTSPPVPSVGIYGTPTMGQAVGSLVPAVGTPVSLPPPAHLVYGVKPPINGPMVQGAPMNADSMKYPVTHR